MKLIAAIRAYLTTALDVTAGCSADLAFHWTTLIKTIAGGKLSSKTKVLGLLPHN